MSGMTVDRRLLPITFGPWFARFQGLTEVQRLAIPPIMAGHDVLICSATASGKTEAYAAPAAEILRQHERESAAALVIAPTRALTNDLKRRLEGPMGNVDVSLGRYTGEHKERVGGKLPAVVIATPEAVDSLLARRPAALQATRYVVLDEIHVLDSTPRGDQLRVLLHRLEQVTRIRPQRVAASATVDRPHELAGRFLRAGVQVVVPGIRKILARPFEGRDPTQVAAHLDDLAGHGFKKLLVFCRSRNQVETFSAKLRNRTRFGDAIHAHHGSLSKNHRERTERLFHLAPAAVCRRTR
jgi:ATP-dependent Lhr-like helicase